MELEPKFGQTIHKAKPTYLLTKPTHYNTATPRFQWIWSQNLVILYTRQSLHTTTQLLQGSSGVGAKIWSNYTQDKAYTLQHSYSKAPVKLEPKFGQVIHKTKPTHYNTATPRFQWSWSYNKATPRLQRSSNQNLVILYTRQSLHTTTQLLQGSSGVGAKIWSNYTQDKAYTLQHSYSKAPVKLEPKFGQVIHKTKPTHYNTATPRFQWSWSYNKATPRLQRSSNQNLVILYTIQSLHTTTQLLLGSSGARAKIWSNYTTRLVYRLLQQSFLEFTIIRTYILSYYIP